MIKLLQKKFALTEQGARGMRKAAVLEFFYNAINLAPVIILMAYLDCLLSGRVYSAPLIYTLSAVTLVVMLLLYLADYDAIYNAIYRESADIRIDMAEHLKQLPLSYFSHNDLSDISQTIMADVTALEHAMGHSVSKASGFFLFFPVISILLLIGNVKLGLAVIIPMLLSILLVFLSKKIQVREATRYHGVLRENAEAFQESIELNQEIKAYGLKDTNREALFALMDRSERIHLLTEIPIMVVILISGFIRYISLAVVIVVGSRLYFAGEIGVLYLVGYILAAAKLKDGLDALSECLAELFYIDASINRIRQIKTSPKQTGEVQTFRDHSIRVEHVGFSYEKDIPVLEDVSFTADENSMVALVGRSGCGKTTALRLISRLYDYQKGRILIGGRDIRDVALAQLFSKVSIVFQDVTLFETDFMENIRLGRDGASDEEVMEAAKLANCHDFIMASENGYRTKIGENGALLSGGERQRISIARAFLKDAPIIILDEITAALDVENERAIQQSINRLVKGRTVIMISHRLKSIEHADKIVVIDKGRTEAEGTHASLLKDSPVYRNLVEKAALADGFVY